MGDLGLNFLGGLGGLAGQVLDLPGDHGKALAGFAGARGFDGGVERQQVGLAGDLVDQLHHLADLLGRLGQAGDGAVGAVGLLDRGSRDAGRLGDLTAISPIELVSSSVAAATVWTLLEACSAAAATATAWRLVWSATADRLWALLCNWVAAAATARTTPSTVRSKPAISRLTVSMRASLACCSAA